MDEKLHSQIYGKGVSPADILNGHVLPPQEVMPLYQDIEERAADAQVGGAGQGGGRQKGPEARVLAAGC